jgi:hypothetical protein
MGSRINSVNCQSEHIDQICPSDSGTVFFFDRWRGNIFFAPIMVNINNNVFQIVVFAIAD